MPTPKPQESEKDFVSRCVPIVIDEGTAKDPKQAAAVCYSMWRDAKKTNNSRSGGRVVILQEARDDAQTQIIGTVFRKQIVKFGTFVDPLYPDEKMVLDKEWAKKVKKNFDSGIVGRIPVPLDHTRAPEANVGELIKLEIEDDGLYGYLDIRRPEVVEDIENGIIFDDSISFDWDYVDTNEGKHHGPALIHVALVNDPYLHGMGSFEQVMDNIKSFSAKFAATNNAGVIMLSESKAKELARMETATVTNDKDYPVDVKYTNADGEEETKTLSPGDIIEVPKEQEEAVTTLINDSTKPDETTEETTGTTDETTEEETTTEEGATDDSSSTDAAELSKARKELSKYRLNDAYTTLLSKGKIVPAQKAKFMELAAVAEDKVQLSKDKSVSVLSMVSSILEAGPKLVDLSESGSNNTSSTAKLSKEDLAGFEAVQADPKKYDELVKSGRIKEENS